MARIKWVGRITSDLKSVGGSGFRKGDEVICKKGRQLSRSINGKLRWNGKYEYFYTNLNGACLVRTTKFLIEGFDEPNLPN